MSKIQSCLIMLRARHKIIKLCWIPIHVNIEGNEKADKLANEATMFEGESAFLLYPYKPFYPIIRTAVYNKWQEQWRIINNSKLRNKKDCVRAWSFLKHKVRKAEAVLTTLRIGYLRVTHGQLMKGRPASYCTHSKAPLTVVHFMTECPDYAQDRLTCFDNSNLQLQ